MFGLPEICLLLKRSLSLISTLIHKRAEPHDVTNSYVSQFSVFIYFLVSGDSLNMLVFMFEIFGNVKLQEY